MIPPSTRVLALLVLGFLSIASHGALSVNGRAQCTQNAKIRSTAVYDTTDSNVIGHLVSGAQGTVISGPVANGGYTWWQIAWDSSSYPTGWTADISLQSISSVPGSFTLSNQAPYWDASSPPGPAVQLNWSTSSGATSYEVYRNGSKIYPTSGTYGGTSFLNQVGLSSGQTYTYYVLAKNGSGSTQSNTINIGPMPNAPAVAPGGFTLSNQAPYWDASSPPGPAVQLNWSTSSGATSYEVYRNGSKIYPTSGTYGGTSFLNQAGLSSGQTYSYYILAKNSNGSTQSNTVNVGPMPSAPVVLPGSFTLSNQAPYWDASSPAGPAVQLNWSTSSSATAYEVYRNGSKIYPTSGTYGGTAFLNQAGLSSGQTYSYYILAKNANGSTQSNTINVGPMPSAPVILPGSFTLSNQAPYWDATSPAGPAVRLDWAASSAATSYEVYRNGSKIYPTTGTFNGTTFLNTAGLASGQTYSYYILAKNANGSTQSNTINVGPMPGAPAVLPGGFTLSHQAPYWDASAPPGPAVQLSWTASANAATYEVYRDGTKIYPLSGTYTGRTFLNEAGLNSGQTYTYVVLAINTDGSTQSNSISVGPMPDAPLAVPGSFSLSNQAPYWDASNPPGPAVQLSWSASSNAATYEVYRNNVKIFPTSGTYSGTVFLNLAGLNSGLTYNYYVLAKNASGSTKSNTLSVGPMPAAPVGPPGAFTLTSQAPYWDASNPPGPAVQLSWSASGNATSYEIYRNGSKIYPLSGSYGGTVFLNQLGLSAGQTYSYYILARNASGSTQSNTLNIGPMPAAPATLPGSFTLSNQPPYWDASIPGPAVRLNWTTSSGASAYEVYRNGSQIFPTSGTYSGTTFLNVAALSSGQTYSYYVVAKNANGTTQSNTLSVGPMPGGPADKPGSFALGNDASYWNGGVSPGSAIPLHWTAAAGAESYDVYRDNVKIYPGSGSYLGQTFLNTAGLVTGQSYSYYVVARNSLGATQSNSVTVVAAGYGAQPDLLVLPASVTFSPASVQPGQQITLHFTVSNVGAGAAAATKARLRLSSDTTLQASDYPLNPLDVDVSALPPGSGVELTCTVTVPLTTPSGSYYPGIFVDSDDRLDQSDATNDAVVALSQLTVRPGVAVPAPRILSQSEDQRIASGHDATLQVNAQGSGVLTYQWFRNDVKVTGSTKALIVVSEGGRYVCQVTSGGQSVLSDPIMVTVDDESIPSFALGDGEILNDDFDPSLPTVVITHGWNPDWIGSHYVPQQPPDWMATMRDAIAVRLQREGIYANAAGHRANFVLYHWPGAYYIDPFFPRYYADAAGADLAKLLKTLLGENYTEKIQFIGHSYGTVVNAVAARDCGYQIQQVTMLDAPLLALGVGSSTYNDRIPLSVAYVDSYIASYPTIVVPFSGALSKKLLIGGKIKNTAPLGGLAVDENHFTITDYYLRTIVGDSKEGFYYSCLLDHFNSRPAPQVWSPEESFLKTTGAIISGDFQIIKGAVVSTTAKVGSSLRDILDLGPANPTPQLRALSDSLSAAAAAPDYSVSETSVDLVVPQDAVALAFDFRFTAGTGVAWLDVSLGRQPMITFPADNLPGTDYYPITIPLQGQAGKACSLKVALDSSEATSRHLQIGHLRFLRHDAVAADHSSLSILAPKPNSRTTTGTLDLKGRATSPRGISSVHLLLNDGTDVLAEGTTAWSGSVTGLLPGMNAVRVVAHDANDEIVATASTLVHYDVPQPLVVSVNDSAAGSISPGFGGTSVRLVGDFYQVTAMPAVGKIFAGWTGSLISSNRSLGFLMREGLTLQANFVANPFGPVKGRYQGPVMGIDSTPEGFFDLTVNAIGTFTGSLRVGAAQFTLRGTLGSDGQFQGVLPDTARKFTVQLDLTGAGQGVSVSFEDADGTARPLIAQIVGFDAKTKPAEEAGRHHVAFMPSAATGEPEGYGFGVATVDRAGNIHFVGTLGDGSPVMQGGSLTQSGTWNFYFPLYTKRGFLTGSLNFPSGQNTLVSSGRVRWLKPNTPRDLLFPDGFLAIQDAFGSRYVPPAANELPLPGFATGPGNGDLSIGSANLAQALETAITLLPNSVTAPSGWSMKFDRTAGSFSGAVTQANSTHRFSGLLFPAQNVAVGQSRVGNFTSYVRLQEAAH